MRGDPKLSSAASGGMDPGLSTYIGSGGAADTASPTNLLSILQATLFGISTPVGVNGDSISNYRRGLTTTPLSGMLPKWIYSNPQLLNAVEGNTFDPYLVTDKPDTWRVYTGGGAVPVPNPRLSQKATENFGPQNVAEGGHDKTEMVATVKNQPFTWSEDQVAEAIKKFQDAGVTNVTDFQSLVANWGGLVEAAGARYSMSSGKLKTTPWDMLALYKSTAAKAGTLGGSGGSPTTVTQRSRSVSTITNGDGWSVLQNTLSRMLGRDPTEEETRDFVGRMNHIAAKNPTITTETKTGIGTSHENVTSHTKAGFDQNDVLQNAYQDAQSNQDYAETQSATTYYNAALSALGAIGG